MGLFFKDKPKQEAVKAEKATSAKTPTVVTTFGGTDFTGIASASNGIDTSEFEGHLDKALEGCGLPKPSFVDLLAALKSVEGQAITTSTKYSLIYTPLKSMGLTKDRLLQTAEQVKQFITKEGKDFEVSIAEMQSSEVQGRLNKIEQINTENQNLASQVEQLQAKMKQNLEQAGTLSEEAEAMRTQIEAKVKGFSGAVQKRLKLIDETLGNVNTYLQ